MATLTEDDFDAKFTQMPAPSGEGMWDTHDPRDSLDSIPPEYIWTVVEGYDENEYIVAGWHFVNRLGYIVTAEPNTDHLTDEFRLD